MSARHTRPRGRLLLCVWDYPPHARGGAEHQARLQAEEFVRRGYAVTVLCPRYVGTRSTVINGVRVVRLLVAPLRPFKRASYLAALALYLSVATRRYDRVFVHLAFFQADIAVAAGLAHRRPVWVRLGASGAGSEIDRMRHVARFTRYFGIRRAHWLQAISEPIATQALGVGVDPQRLVRIPNGADLRRFRPAADEERAELRRRLALPNDGVLVLFVGRFSRQKGVHDLVRVWQPPPAGVFLILVGSDRTVERVRLLRDGPRRLVRPWVEDVAEYYRACDIFVLPSYIEGMSNALLEAMGSGLPVIVTRVGAAEAMVEEGDSGFLIVAGDTDALRERIERLAADADLRRRMGAKGRASVLEHFGIERVVDRIEDLCWREAAK